MTPRIDSSEHVCQTCRHFFRHYTKRNQSYIPTNFGHCPYPRVKIRTLQDSCPRWQQAANEAPR